jgi:cbb3-type cytochrome oxidase maturation protein
MSMLYVLIPLALMLLAVAVWALIWAIRSGQFDDLESHGWSVVLDDDQKPPPEPLEGGRATGSMAEAEAGADAEQETSASADGPTGKNP